MSFQVGIGSLGGTVFFSGGTLYPSANYEGFKIKWLASLPHIFNEEVSWLENRKWVVNLLTVEWFISVRPDSRN